MISGFKQYKFAYICLFILSQGLLFLFSSIASITESIIYKGYCHSNIVSRFKYPYNYIESWNWVLEIERNKWNCEIKTVESSSENYCFPSFVNSKNKNMELNLAEHVFPESINQWKHLLTVLVFLLCLLSILWWATRNSISWLHRLSYKESISGCKRTKNKGRC